jgi:hypothetical protein
VATVRARSTAMNREVRLRVFEECVAAFVHFAPGGALHFDPVTTHGAVGAVAAFRDDTLKAQGCCMSEQLFASSKPAE